MDGINPLLPSGLVGTATSQSRGPTGQGPQLPELGQLLKALVVEAQDGGRFLLDIGGNRLSASSTAPLAQGQALQLQVVRTEPQVELKIVNDNAPAPLVGRSLTLLGKSVDVSTLFQIKAEVVEASAGGHLVIDVGGTRLAASSGAPLPQGRDLQLQVVATEPQIEMKIVDGPTAALTGRSLILLDKSVEVSSLLAGQPAPSVAGSLNPAVREVLETFFTLPPKILAGEEAGPNLKHLIDHLGLNLEHLLAQGDKDGAVKTLKAALLDLLHNFPGNGRTGEEAGRLATTLELFQLSQLQAGPDVQYLFPLPLPFVEQGYLLIEDNGQGSAPGSSDPAERRFSLNVTMSDLGNLRIDFLHNSEGLFIRFAADSKDKAEFLATFGDDLKASITTAPLIGLTFAGGAPDPISDLLRRLVPEGGSMLDTKV